MRKRIIILLLLTLCAVPIAFAADAGIGAKLIRDPYNKKIFIMDYLPASSALDSGIPVGAEIISVNGKKVKELSQAQVVNLIKGEEGTTVKLLIKDDKKTTEYEVVRKVLNAPDITNDKFFMYWQQVAPPDFDPSPIPKNLAKNLSCRYRNEFIPRKQYWLQRKVIFEHGYNACMTYPENEQNTCLSSLVEREIYRTSQDQQLELQQNMQKQQALQDFTNGLNQIQTNNQLQMINNNLQQQNFQIQQQNFQIQQQNFQLQNINNSLYRY